MYDVDCSCHDRNNFLLFCPPLIVGTLFANLRWLQTFCSRHRSWMATCVGQRLYVRPNDGFRAHAWRHQMETFSALLALCAGNSPVAGEFPSQRPVTRSFDVFFDLCLNNWLSKQSWGWWFERHRIMTLQWLSKKPLVQFTSNFACVLIGWVLRNYSIFGLVA